MTTSKDSRIVSTKKTVFIQLNLFIFMDLLIEQYYYNYEGVRDERPNIHTPYRIAAQLEFTMYLTDKKAMIFEMLRFN